MPLSVQIVARPNDEPTLISLAAEIESERPWAEKFRFSQVPDKDGRPRVGRGRNRTRDTDLPAGAECAGPRVPEFAPVESVSASKQQRSPVSGSTWRVTVIGKGREV